MKLNDYLQQRQTRITQFLAEFLPSETTAPERLHAAMRYAVLNGGKRLRPLLVYATGEIFTAKLTDLDHAAGAVELIHCYSLVHDDLPAMDDDDLRRGQPTCHKAFDEATAILAGDALQCLAFKMLTSSNLTPMTQLEMITVLAEASGSHGMAGGQALDLLAEGQYLELEQLEKLHSLKTGMLIRTSVIFGALAAKVDKNILVILDEFAQAIGLAFQIQDDILDIESTTEKLGKRQGADLIHEKSTYPGLIGMSAAKAKVQQLHMLALEKLVDFNHQANSLRTLTNFLMNRDY